MSLTEMTRHSVRAPGDLRCRMSRTKEILEAFVWPAPCGGDCYLRVRGLAIEEGAREGFFEECVELIAAERRALEAGSFELGRAAAAALWFFDERLAERLARVDGSEFDFLKACLEGGPEPCAQLRWAHFGSTPSDAIRA